MQAKKHDRFEEIVRDLASRFLSLESNRTSLITVTKVEANERATHTTIYITAFPENQEQAALDFARRQRSAFRDYVKEHSRLMRIPMFDFKIDMGEKARQKIDALV
ncbi:MAG: ribosome-binding factor A [Candidatus Paceibacterota bacterium]|jgi:ribosome-binding factor A